MTKQGIRKKILQKRRNLPNEKAINYSKKIYKRLISTKEFKNAKTIMFYITKDNEVDTKPMIENTLRQGKNVCAPCTDKDKCELHPAIIKDLKEDLVEGNYCILEPRKRNSKPGKIDLIITPGIAFDTNGYRLGWGKAYYDRFLEKRRDIPTIGLAYDFQVVEKLPIDKHDISIDKVITERRIIKNNPALSKCLCNHYLF